MVTKNILNFVCSDGIGSYHKTHYTCSMSVGTQQTGQPQFLAAYLILASSTIMWDYCNSILVYQNVLRDSSADWVVEGGHVRLEGHLKGN